MQNALPFRIGIEVVKEYHNDNTIAWRRRIYKIEGVKREWGRFLPNRTVPIGKKRPL